MLTAPVPSPFEARTNAAFDALLWALSRPGMMRRLPEAGEGAIIDALLDRECRVYSADPLLVPQILRSGAEIAEIDAADHAFLGAPDSAEVLRTLALGSDLYPDDGATVVIRARLGQGAPLRLTGPGVDGVLRLQVGGLPDGFWEIRAQIARYPMGFDLFLLDGDRLIGVPRSTTVEVL